MELMRWMKYQWDRVTALVLLVIGLVVLLIGWIGVSGTVYPSEQLPYIISGGILGIFFLGTAGVLYVSADMRDEWRKLDGIEEALRRLEPHAEVPEAPTRPRAATKTATASRRRTPPSAST